MAEITREGVIQKTTAEYIQELNEAWRIIFGTNLNLGPDTPQGQLTNLQGVIASKFEQTLTDIARSLDIAQAQGQQLEDLTSILAIYRDGAENSSFSASLTGTPLRVIPAGSQAKTAAGDIFILQASVQLTSGGTGTGQFVAAEVGPVQIDGVTVISISTPVAGWDTVSTPTSTVIGRDVETDGQFKRRYFNQLARASTGQLEGIISGIEGLDDVETAAGVENQTGVVKEDQGVRIPPHGFVVAVDGTDYDAIAAEIRLKKSFGSCSLQYIECAITSDGACTAPAGAIATVDSNAPVTMVCAITANGACTAPAGAKVIVPAASNSSGIDCVFQLVTNVVFSGAGTLNGNFLCITQGSHSFASSISLTKVAVAPVFPAQVTGVVNNTAMGFVFDNTADDTELRLLGSVIFTGASTANAYFVCINDGTHEFYSGKSLVLSGFPTTPNARITGVVTNDYERFIHRNVDVENSNGRVLQSVPINFKACQKIPLKVIVTITSGSDYPQNGDDLIKAAIVEFATGNGVFDGYQMGETVYASQLYSPVNSVINMLKGANITSIKIGISSAVNDSVTMNLDQQATIATGDISIP